jgi:hypothetical protein
MVRKLRTVSRHAGDNASMMNAAQSSPNNFESTSQLSWPGHMADDIAATYGPEPMANLTATAESLNVSSTRGNFRVPRTAVTKLGRGNFYPWFFSAIRIHHTVQGYPRSLQFKPLGLKPREVLMKLRDLGYPV